MILNDSTSAAKAVSCFWAISTGSASTNAKWRSTANIFSAAGAKGTAKAPLRNSSRAPRSWKFHAIAAHSSTVFSKRCFSSEVAGVLAASLCTSSTNKTRYRPRAQIRAPSTNPGAPKLSSERAARCRWADNRAAHTDPARAPSPDFPSLPEFPAALPGIRALPPPTDRRAPLKRRSSRRAFCKNPKGNRVTIRNASWRYNPRRANRSGTDLLHRFASRQVGKINRSRQQRCRVGALFPCAFHPQ